LGQSGAQLSLVSGSIQEISILKDGFDPEYGDALSGIVNIRTQTGSKDVTKANVQFITDDFGNATLNKYSRNSDFVRFSLSGPDPIFKSKIFPALGINYFDDKELTYYFYAEVDKDDGFYQYDEFDSPATTRSYGYFDLFGIHVPERANNRYYWASNIQFRPRQNLKFLFSYKNQQEKQILFDWNYRYSSATAPILDDVWDLISLEVTHAIGRNFHYETVLSYHKRSITQKPGDPNNPGHGLDPDQILADYETESYQDLNANGVYDAPEPIINLYPDTIAYGDNYNGPAYTFGENNLETNFQGGDAEVSGFRFNNNHYADMLEGEPYLDLNGNGVWDRGDFINDRNGNGVLDSYRRNTINSRTQEPYIDGDSIIGEPFTDVNGDRVFQPGIDRWDRSTQDLNRNGLYDGPDTPFWTPEIPFVDNNGNGLYDLPNFQWDQGEPYNDINGNAVYDAGGSSSFLDPFSYSDASNDPLTWHHREINTSRGEVKAFWQLGSHELKGGVSMKNIDFIFQDIEQPYVEYLGIPDGGPYPNRGAFRDIFAYSPWAGSLYFRDKLEYGSMIANLGLRWDFFLQDMADLVDIARNDNLGSGVILGDRQKISPRIGFSYPISDKAKVYFNYGHFYQLPSFQRLYARNTASVNRNAVVGNYNLDYQKTIQYSFGVKYAMTEHYSIDIGGYFKDEFDKINIQRVVDDNGIVRQQYRNSDYGRGRGFELQLEKRGGGYVSGFLSYTYAFAYGKASQTNENYLTDFELSREPLSESPLDNDVRHSLKSSVAFYVPTTVKPRLFGVPIMNGWSLSVVAQVESGRPFTPTRAYPNITQSQGEDIQINSLRRPALVNFDLRFQKEFKLAGLDYNFIAQIENVFDNRNVVNVYRDTGRPDTRQNQSGVIKGGTPFDANPANWDFGRQIRLGIELNL
ncbi:MAG: TonB-dependent receptor domain-containing protein, partial [Candidatus Zixiibacteriota bacterium]